MIYLLEYSYIFLLFYYSTYFYFLFSIYEQNEAAFIEELNSALKEGWPSPVSKKGDLVPRLSVVFHVIEQLFEMMNNPNKLSINEEIQFNSLMNAINFVEYVEDQKELLKSVRIFFTF